MNIIGGCLIAALLIAMDVAAQIILRKAKELEIIEMRKQNNEF